MGGYGPLLGAAGDGHRDPSRSSGRQAPQRSPPMRPRHPFAAALAAGLTAGSLAVAPAAPAQDLRSPDARDAANAPVLTGQDLRSPDAQDRAGLARTVEVVPAPTVETRVVESSSGLDWGSAAIGAAGVIGLIAVSLGAGLGLRRRHAERTLPAHRSPAPPA